METCLLFFCSPFGSRAMSVQGVSNCLASGILLRGRGVSLAVTLSLRSTVRTQSGWLARSEFVGAVGVA